MDVKPEPTTPACAAPAVGELIVQTGRQAGVRRPLNIPVMLIGRASGCDLRLNAEGVAPLHCLIAHSPNGVVLRDLQSATGTTINGSPATSQPLHDGDTLNVGPFQFRLHLPPTPPAVAETCETNPAEKEALRIQAAAVAAQQTGLLEEEARLQQQRATLEQQEGQLAAHLEDKRLKLVQLTEQAQVARAALQQEQATYKEHVDRVTHDLSASQRDLLEGQQKIQKERQRLGELRRRLEQRANRLLEGERKSLSLREGQLATAQKQLEQHQERLRQEREALRSEGLRFNGDRELGRRQLQHVQQQFQQEQEQVRQRQAEEQTALRRERKELEKREGTLVEARRVFANEQLAWERRLTGLVAEAEGLENRIRNQRRKIQEQQQQLEQSAAQVRARQQETPSAATASEIPAAVPVVANAPEQPRTEETAAAPAAPAPAPAVAPSHPALPAVVRSHVFVVGAEPRRSEPVAPTRELLEALNEREVHLSGQEQALKKRLAALEKLASDLADQRAQLAEQWQQLAQSRQQWQQEYQAVAAELEATLAGYPEREAALNQRLQTIATAEAEVRCRMEENVQRRQELEAWTARLQAEQAGWCSERDQMLADVRGRVEVADKTLAAVLDLRQRWVKRRRQELELLHTERSRYEKDRKEWATLREELWQRGVTLEDERRSLAEKTLVLEQYKQETILRASDAAGAERRVERLRQRWQTQQAALLRETEEKRQTLFAEAARLEERQATLHQQLETLAMQQANLAQRQAEWEQTQVQTEAEQAKTQQQLHSALQQRDRQEQQIRELRDEIDHIAQVLLEETSAAPSLFRAA